MNNIYKLIKLDKNNFNELKKIENKNIVLRQNNSMFELKENNESNEELLNFIDINYNSNILVSTGHLINAEFQQYINIIMKEYGNFCEGPIKNIERVQSKLENDYSNEIFPKCSKILDVCRNSITFNTVKQLIMVIII